MRLTSIKLHGGDSHRAVVPASRMTCRRFLRPCSEHVFFVSDLEGDLPHDGVPGAKWCGWCRRKKRAETWTEIEFFKQAFFKPASLHDLSLENFESSRG